MKFVIQRVLRARVKSGGIWVGEIGPGIVSLIGIGKSDTEATVRKAIEKIVRLRIFEAENGNGKMDRSLIDVGGSHLMVSQFTLFADLSKGNRPSFLEAAGPESALSLFEFAVQVSRELGVQTEAGKFQTHMEVDLVNDGPVTLCGEMN